MVGGAEFNGGDVTGVHGEDDLWLTKFAASGGLVWQKALGGSGSEFGRSVIEAMDGGFVCAGRSDSNDGDVTGNHGQADAWIVKTNGAGTIEWETSLGGSATDFAWDIIQTADGGFVVVGEAASSDGDVSVNLGANDFWVVRLSSEGDLLWERSYGGSSSDWATTVSEDPDGNLLVAGVTTSSDLYVTGFHGGGLDIWAIMLNATGELLWQRALGGSGSDMCFRTFADNGGLYVACSTSSGDGDVTSTLGADDAWLVSLSHQGDILWQSSFGGSGNDSARGLGRNADGNLMVMCSTNSVDGQVSSSLGGYDVWLLKVGEQGSLVWEASYGGSDDDLATRLWVVQDDGYFISAYSYSEDLDLSENNGSADFWAVKLNAEPIGVSESRTLSSATPFPNPAHDKLWIRCTFGERIKNAELYDLSGHQLASRQDLRVNALDVSALGPGSYYCRMQDDKGVMHAVPFMKE